MPENIRLFIRRDMRVQQPQFARLFLDVAIADIDIVIANRLDFRA